GSRAPMSALGQKQTCAVQKGMSALPPERRHRRARSAFRLSALPVNEQSSCGDKEYGNTLLYSRLPIQRIQELVAISVPLWLKSDPRAKLHDLTHSARPKRH